MGASFMNELWASTGPASTAKGVFTGVAPVCKAKQIQRGALTSLHGWPLLVSVDIRYAMTLLVPEADKKNKTHSCVFPPQLMPGPDNWHSDVGDWKRTGNYLFIFAHVTSSRFVKLLVNPTSLTWIMHNWWSVSWKWLHMLSAANSLLGNKDGCVKSHRARLR